MDGNHDVTLGTTFGMPYLVSTWVYALRVVGYPWQVHAHTEFYFAATASVYPMIIESISILNPTCLFSV